MVVEIEEPMGIKHIECDRIEGFGNCFILWAGTQRQKVVRSEQIKQIVSKPVAPLSQP